MESYEAASRMGGGGTIKGFGGSGNKNSNKKNFNISLIKYECDGLALNQCNLSTQFSSLFSLSWGGGGGAVGS